MLSYFQKFTASINKWIGKANDYDLNKSSQCVDWSRQYCADMGTPIGTFGGSAINCWNTGCAFDKSWKRVVKTSINFPSPGDVVFWRTGQYGHTAIADNWSTIAFLKVIEQNGATGNGKWQGGDAIRRKTYDYHNPECVWWFTRQF